MASRVLIVDDDPHTRRALARLVRSGGLTAETAGTVGEALEKLGGQHVAILDLRLPDGTGLDVFAAIRARHPDTRVAIVSAERAGRLLDDALALRPDAHFFKPPDPKALLAWIVDEGKPQP